jgi:predicted transcriptional regulator of viral defense system
MNNGKIFTTNMNKILELSKTDKEIFSTQDLAVIWNQQDKRKLYEIIKYYLRTNQLHQITRGIYSIEKLNEKDITENISLAFKIAQKISPNSYISLYTALKYHGLIFQYYESIYSIGERNVEREVFNKKFIYKSIKDDIFRNERAIISKNGYRIASKERAVCDTLYLIPNVGIDDIEALNKKEVEEISKIYRNKSLDKRLKLLFQ